MIIANQRSLDELKLHELDNLSKFIIAADIRNYIGRSIGVGI